MKSDFHMHTCYSSDADQMSTPETQILAAIGKGLEIICITDHHDMDYPMNEVTTKLYEETGVYPFLLNVDEYFKELGELSVKYRDKIDVRIGIEIGLMPHLGDYHREFVNRYPFDFVIGSAHNFNGQDPYYSGLTDPRPDQAVYRQAFEEMLQDVRNNHDFDVLGHIDYVVRYGKEKTKHYRYSDVAEIIDEILRTVIADGKGIELNTAGLKYGLGFAHPRMEILKRYKELGGEIITVGADGHCPEHIAYAFDRAESILAEAGFHYYTIFRDRQPEFVKTGF